jgi:hypothetical protein
MKKQVNFWTLTVMIVLSISSMNCAKDLDCLYTTNINNNTSYDIVVHFSDDSTIVCPPEQETIVEESYGTWIAYMSTTAPSIFKDNIAEIIIDEGNRILTKDISNDNNWSFKGDKEGKYYGKITSTFVINEEDIKEVKQ